MKKRILSILLLCCMVLTLLPTAAFAAGELPDVKLSVPTTFDKIVDLTEQNKELKIKDSKTYLIKGSELVFSIPNQNRWQKQYTAHLSGRRPPSGTKGRPCHRALRRRLRLSVLCRRGQRADRRGELRRAAEKQNRWLSPGSGADGDKAHV